MSWIELLSFLLSCTSIGISIYVWTNIRKEQNKPKLLATGVSGNRQLEEAWLELVAQMFSTFQKKSHDYGTENPINGGIKGVVLRMGDKSARLWRAIFEDNALLVNESVEDTLLDLANYALIGTLLLRGEWPVSKQSIPFSREHLITVLKELTNETNDDLR